MNLETVILGLLNKEPMSGYDLSKRIDSSVGFFWHATHPQIYRSLKKLESGGQVTFDHEIQESGPARKVYSLTKRGKAELLHQLSSIDPYLVKFPLLVAMFLGSELGVQFWCEALETQIQDQEANLQLYYDILEEIPRVDSNDDLGDYLRKRTLDFGIGHQKLFIKWLKQTLKEISRRSEGSKSSEDLSNE